MRYVVAVSGGVDSVVLLDMIAQEVVPERLVVAHFDHGIRPESAEDATFVKNLAERYGLTFETKREELGVNASEELARERRYAFLREVAKRYSATIMTAHHADDIIETIAINMTRGTGWRGLAVLDSPDLERPLLDKTKAELIEYAKENLLEWHEDVTNTDTKYLRNDFRQKLTGFDDESKELLRLYRKRQVALKKQIDNEIRGFIQAPYSRYLLTNVPRTAALELLRGILVFETGRGATRPQRERMLLAIKTYRPGQTFDIDKAYLLRFSRSDFAVENR